MFSGNLASAFAVDYEPLQSILSTQQWREADRQTTRWTASDVSPDARNKNMAESARTACQCN